MCGSVEKWRNCCRKCGVFLTRLVFLFHGIIAITLLYVNKDFQQIHMLLLIPLGFLIVECVLEMCFDFRFRYER